MVNIIQSLHALAEPKLVAPRTSDMADIVAAFRSNGLIRPVPSAFQLHDGTMVMHPVLYSQFQKALKIKAERMRNDLDRAFIMGHR